LPSALDFEEFGTDSDSIELNPVEHELIPLQLTIHSQGVGLTFPNWKFERPQITALRRYWDLIFEALTREGLVGYDSQLDTKVTVATFNQVISSTSEAAAQLRAIIGKPKPWWKFW
jgi:hypothetical protein